ncbi:MAG TPA: acyltransferase [Ilumatobacteraceae bacterium]|nr:acyltransferase [Ilumatobacteraceae bacterium]
MAANPKPQRTADVSGTPTDASTVLGIVAQRLHSELHNINWRTSLFVALANCVPAPAGIRLRTQLLRAAGMRMGPGSAVGGRLRLVGEGRARASRVTMGRNCWINDSCSIDASDTITMGDGVAFGHEVMLITSTHEIGPHQYRAGKDTTQPITIGDGVWIGARAVVLPGVTIGNGSIVAAGAVVNRPVGSNVLVAGVPARFVKHLDAPASASGVQSSA